MEALAVNPLHISTIVEKDVELHLTSLPCRKGDRVEAVLVVLEGDDADRERALEQFLAGAVASALCSVGPYPTRDELHERP